MESDRARLLSTPNLSLEAQREAVEGFLNEPGEESFKALFRAIAPGLVCFFRVRGCGFELAEDLTQEVMLAVYRGVQALRNRDLFRPWLFGIARNVLLRHIRDAGRRPSTVPFAEDAEETIAGTATPLLGPEIAEWLAALEPDERRIMMLRYLDGLEHHEIAALLRVPLGTV
jgi:RNA polymerase sigma factor (sigma-70 family)